MPVDATSLGGSLRQERERQQVSLQDISAATKIQLRFLEALEKDEYETLPPSPFVVGFLRAYAQYLHIDPEGIVTTYRALQRPAVDETGPAVPPPLQTSGTSPLRVRFTALGIVALLVVFIFVLAQPWRNHTTELSLDVTSGERQGYSGSQGLSPLPGMPASSLHEKSAMSDAATLRPAIPILEEPKVSVTEKLPTPEKPLSTKVDPPGPPGTPGTPGTSSMVLPPPPAQQPPSPSTTPTRLVLRAEATAETWLRVKIDGEKSQELLLGTGKDVSWEATDRFLLTIGNARGTRLTLNGQEVKLPASRNNVIRDLVVTRETPH